MKKEYEKPVIEVVELRPEEQIGICTFWSGNKEKHDGINQNCKSLQS